MADKEDSEVLGSLIAAVHKQLEEPSWFVPDDAAVIRNLLCSEKGLAWKAVEAETGTCAGMLLVFFPGTSEENLGNDAGLLEEEKKMAAHIESVAILPEFRGNGLQAQMMRLAEEEVRKRGYRYLLCTVHPENRFSRNNMVKAGFSSIVKKEKYGGLLREIMMKQLEKIE